MSEDDQPEDQLTTIDIEYFTGPQTSIVRKMVRFSKLYDNGEGNIQEAIEAYDEEHYGPRFEIPAYCGTTGPQPMRNILRFRVWHKSADPENPGSSRFEEFSTLGEALEGRADLIEGGYQRIDPPVGVCWDNAIGSFTECCIAEMMDMYPSKDD